ncbi:MAG: hypothetical protein HS111_36900 [Kofleriaceae bacterium]|nr:hypothetical protein [Kofleriaceae bacterium]MCL4226318.1 hypothetical protein [Myxococcales bacterium]
MKPKLSWSLSLALLLPLAACGPNLSGGDDDDDGQNGADARTDQTCVPTGPETCDNLTDDDCDGRVDCDDSDCAAVPGCNAVDDNCGTLQSPEASLALPDDGSTAFTSPLNFTGFTPGQVLTDISKLQGVCVTMEHSWIRDLQIEMSCPTGQNVILSMFLGRTGGEVHLGIPNDSDGVNPVPGTGYDYCWTPTATNPPMLEYANQTGVRTLPAGDYRSSTPMDALEGCLLNGNWTLRVFDMWPIDNGFIFKWWIRFDASLVEDCASWPG